MIQGRYDLELVEDGNNLQTVGLRFQNVQVPQGATIYGAYVVFTADETHSGQTDLTFHGQASDNAAAFSNTDYDISARPKTAAAMTWNNVPPWDTIHATYQTPDLAALIQEIVDRPGWSPGNTLALIVTGSGTRTAEAYDGEPTMAPELHITYGSGGGPTPTHTPTPTSTPVGTPTYTPTPTATPVGGRVTAGLQALYTFDEGSGAAVHDTLGVGTALDLTIGDTNNVTWLAGGGLNVHTSTTILSPGTATKVINACVASDEVTLEAWVQPADDVQSLSRILALAQDRTYRNAMLAQDGDEYQLRVRTTDTDDSGNPKFETDSGTVVTAQSQHVVYSRDSAAIREGRMAWELVAPIAPG